MQITQVMTCSCNNGRDMNEKLAAFCREHPQWKIINVNTAPNDYGWYMTIVFNMEVRQ